MFQTKFLHLFGRRFKYTAQNLQKKGISAMFLGSPMMDKLEPRGIYIGEPPVVGIFPGSRFETYDNFVKTLEVVKKIKEKASFVCALSQSLDMEQITNLTQKNNWTYKNKVLEKSLKLKLIF